MWFEVDFGPGQTGLATVGYRLYLNDGTDDVARTTLNVVEIAQGGYGVDISSVATTSVGIEWDTGGGSPIYAREHLDHSLIADYVWDEVLTGATHNVPTSAGRRLRGIQDFQGYENGAIWIDTVNGDSGTTEFENGTVENPVDTLADAITLNSGLGFNRFVIFNGSTITLSQTFNNFLFTGENWILNLNGQDAGGTHFHGAAVTGIETGTETSFISCHMGTCTIDLMHLENCSLGGTLTAGAVGDHHLWNCHSAIAGTATPVFNVDAVLGNSNINFRGYSGGIEFRNLGQTGTDTISLEGNGQLVLAASCVGGSINVRGNFELTDNSSTTTVNDDARYDAPRHVDLVWDEPLTGATHNDPTSSGRQLRELRETNVYDGGRIWIDTVDGTAGSANYENGTVDFPVDNIADAVTISNSLGIKRFIIAPGSSITLVNTFTNYIFEGENWTLALGGQDVAGTLFHGAHVTGICTGATQPEFITCSIGIVTVPPCHFRLSDLNATITLGSAGDYFFDLCHSAIAGTGTPVIDFGAAIGSSSVNLRHWSGGIQVENMGDAGTDLMSIEGDGQFIEGTCTGGTVAIRGDFNVSGITNLTIIRDDSVTGSGLMIEDYPVDGQSAMTQSQALYALVQMMSEFVRAGTTITVKERDGVTTAFTIELDDAGNPTTATQSP